MARDIWLISDTHFNHYNIVHKFQPARPFKDVTHMNEAMIEGWNSVVKPGDKVYHLGDVFFGDKEWFKRNWPRLNGKKRLVVGNHCDVKFMAAGGFFEKIMMWRKLDNLLLTHVPVHPSTLGEHRFDKPMLNVHGHTHFRGPPKGPYVSVCAELIAYKPIHIEDVAALHKYQQEAFHGRKDTM